MTAPDRDRLHPPAAPPADPPPLGRCVDGPALCEVRVYTEAEWAALPPAERPARHAHYPGLGWVAAVPVGHLN